ncbi:MAG: phosphate acyltransferase PlsX [Pseudomonadota bacterium]
MTETITIALDAMGGDVGPAVVVPGAALAREAHPDLAFAFCGDETRIRAEMAAHPALEGSEVHHSDVAVSMDEKPSQALRRGRRVSSMWLALDAVKQRRAHAAVSAGNTGALMAMSRLCVKMVPGIERPAIAAIWPTLRGRSIVLDVGATIGAEAGQLVDNAVMGAAMARALFEKERPSVGLLNIGVEEVKGLDGVREAGERLRAADPPGFDYHGFVEGDDLGKGTVDVVVTEGFSGNIALKTAEGTARQIAEYLRLAMSRTLRSKIGYLLAKDAFDELRAQMDPRKVNGGVFLGLDGIVIKSHGGTDAEGFAAAVTNAYNVARFGLVDRITADLMQLRPEDGIEEVRTALKDDAA